MGRREKGRRREEGKEEERRELPVDMAIISLTSASRFPVLGVYPLIHS